MTDYGNIKSVKIDQEMLLKDIINLQERMHNIMLEIVLLGGDDTLLGATALIYKLESPAGEGKNSLFPIRDVIRWFEQYSGLRWSNKKCKFVRSNLRNIDIKLACKNIPFRQNNNFAHDSIPQSLVSDYKKIFNNFENVCYTEEVGSMGKRASRIRYGDYRLKTRRR